MNEQKRCRFTRNCVYKNVKDQRPSEAASLSVPFSFLLFCDIGKHVDLVVSSNPSFGTGLHRSLRRRCCCSHRSQLRAGDRQRSRRSRRVLRSLVRFCVLLFPGFLFLVLEIMQCCQMSWYAQICWNGVMLIVFCSEIY